MTTTARLVSMNDETVDRMLRHFDTLEDALLALSRRHKLLEESRNDWKDMAETAMEAMEAAVKREDETKTALNRLLMAYLGQFANVGGWGPDKASPELVDAVSGAMLLLEV